MAPLQVEQEKKEVVDMMLAIIIFSFCSIEMMFGHIILIFLFVSNDVGHIIFTPPLSR